MTREKAIDIIKCLAWHTRPDEEEIEQAIKALEQEPKTGHWIKTGDYYTGAYDSIDYVECSCCHEDSLEEGNFCPNCGADMREVLEDGKID